MPWGLALRLLGMLPSYFSLGREAPKVTRDPRSPLCSVSESTWAIFGGSALFHQRGDEGLVSWGVSSKHPHWAADSSRLGGAEGRAGQHQSVLVSVELAWTLRPRVGDVPDRPSASVLAWFTVWAAASSMSPSAKAKPWLSLWRVISRGRRWNSVWFRTGPRATESVHNTRQIRY